MSPSVGGMYHIHKLLDWYYSSSVCVCDVILLPLALYLLLQTSFNLLQRITFSNHLAMLTLLLYKKPCSHSEASMKYNKDHSMISKVSLFHSATVSLWTWDLCSTVHHGSCDHAPNMEHVYSNINLAWCGYKIPHWIVRYFSFCVVLPRMLYFMFICLCYM